MPIFSRMVRGKFYVNAIKRIFDVLAAMILAIALLPIFLLLTILVALDLRKSPIFRQQRIGKKELQFSLLKFKTMRADDDESTISGFGKFLRSTSLDELPQLINVIRMEMSLVGPRPLLPEYLPFYSTDEKRRHTVMPGITGWAQVNGRNEIDWGKRLKMDIYYAENISLWMDLKILALTAKLLLKRDRSPYKKDRTIKFSEYASKR